MSRRVHLHLSDDLADELDAICRRTHESRSAVVERLVNQYVAETRGVRGVDRAYVYAETALAELETLRSSGL